MSTEAAILYDAVEDVSGSATPPESKSLETALPVASTLRAPITTQRLHVSSQGSRSGCQQDTASCKAETSSSQLLVRQEEAPRHLNELSAQLSHAKHGLSVPHGTASVEEKKRKSDKYVCPRVTKRWLLRRMARVAIHCPSCICVTSGAGLGG